MAKKLFAFLFLIAVAAMPARAQQPVPEGQRVFVCAHSFMIFTAKLLPPMAEAAKIKHVNAGQQMIGGSRTIQHWNLPHEKNSAKKALREGTVDVFLCSPHLQIPDEGIDHFAKLGLEKNPKLRVLVQASWIPQDGVLKGFKNARRNDATLDTLKALRGLQKNYAKKLDDQVAALNKELGKEAVSIVPVWDAVITLREKIVEGKAPGFTKQTDLFTDDLGHAAPALALLVTYCHFASIYKVSPEGLPVPKELKDKPRAAEMTKLLQEIAWQTVKPK